MHFEPQAVPAEMPSLVQRFVSITSWKPWEKRLKAFDQRVADNPFLDEYLAQRYPIELAMGRLHRRLLRRQKVKLPTSYEDTVLLSFIAMVARAHPRLNPPGRRRLDGMLRSGLDTDAGLAPLEHEMGIATHLMGRGFDVTFSDIETGTGFDFLAEKDGAVLEVECKTVSGDLGRRIHLRRLYQLGGRVYPLMSAALERCLGGQLARIVLPSRLHGTDQQLEAICEALASALNTGRSIVGPEPCAIEYQQFSLAGSPFERVDPANIGREDVRQYVEQAVGRPLGHVVMLFRPRSGLVMVAVESLQKDEVVKGLVQQLKDAVKRQFSGTRPGVVCVKFIDVTQRDLLELVEQDRSDQPSTLKLATSYLLNRPDWTPVHTLAYFTPGHSVTSQVVNGPVLTRSVQEQGHTYTFKNPHNAMAGDARLSIF